MVLMFHCISAYSLKTWLMKPFTHGTPQQKTFNYRICRARIVVENAYGRLKARWRKLMKRNDMTIDNVITCVCVLHNICEVHGETFNDAWLQEVENNAAMLGMELPADRNKSEMR